MRGTTCALLVVVSILLTAEVASISSSSDLKTKLTKSTRSTTKAASVEKISDEKRGKRTLFDFDNAEHPAFKNFSNRRQDYADQGRTYYTPQDNFYNAADKLNSFGQDGFNTNQLQTVDYQNPYASYQQYIQPPEPIIEIIIKDSNETVPAPVPSKPIIVKKKKEKVHVYYVKYKKDENNKLHLESPIASLNNDDNEEEEEEIIDIPTIVTSIPPLKTTTLRTVIIHPDSEKYHSNSGIHVTFGSEDKTQSGHLLDEDNEGSEIKQTVTLPQQKEQQQHHHANVRADFETANPRSQSSNHNGFKFYQQLPSTLSSGRNFHQKNIQELPTVQAAEVFRPQKSENNHNQYQIQQQQYHQQQQLQQFSHQQQQQFFQQPLFQQQKPKVPINVQFPSSYHGSSQKQPLFPVKTQTPKQTKYQQQPQPQPQLQPQQPLNYQNYNQYFPNYKSQTVRTPTQAQPQKHTPFFPTPLPPKQQENQFNNQNLAPTYQPVKFRPTVPSHPTKSNQFPLKVDSSIYYQQSNNRNPYQHQHQQQKHQNQQQLQPFSYNRPYFEPPAFPNSSQYQSESPLNSKLFSHSPHSSQNKEHKFHQKGAAQFTTNNNNKYQPQQFGGISSTNSFYDQLLPSKETELLKAIPRFEQHITETINHGNPHAQQQLPAITYHHYPYSTSNQAIHDIPAPKLGPTPSTLPHGHTSTARQPDSYSPELNSQQFGSSVTTNSDNVDFNYFTSSTAAPQYAETDDGQKVQIVTPMPTSNNYYNQNNAGFHSSLYTAHGSQPQVIPNSQPLHNSASQYVQQPRNNKQAKLNENHFNSADFSVSTLHSDVFKELEQRKSSDNAGNDQFNQQTHTTHDKQKKLSPSSFLQNQYRDTHSKNHHSKGATTSSPAAYRTTTTATTQKPSLPSLSSPTKPSTKATQNSLQLPDEVPDDLRNQLLSSGILENADISILDYDKIGDVALENLPAEHLQHFYGAGGAAQISGSSKVLTVVKPNGDSVDLSSPESPQKTKDFKTVPQHHNIDIKVVRFDASNQTNVANHFLNKSTHLTVVPPVDLTDRKYNRYLPLKINGTQFPIPDVDELRHKKIVSIVVLAPVDSIEDEISAISPDGRPERKATIESKEVKFVEGDTIKQLLKKPTKENFKRWLEKEAQTDVDMQSVVLLVTRTPNSDEQEIFMYEITTGAVNKLNGELSSAFVKVAEDNASSEDLEHASTLDPDFLENMMNKMSGEEKV